MSAYQIFTLPAQQALDSSARVLAGAKLYFFETGTSTPTDAYTDSGLSTPTGNPLTADAGGVFDQFFLDPAVIYRIVLKSSAGVTLKTWDPANENVIAYFTQSVIGALLYPRTAAEVSAGVTPVNYAYPPGDVRRYVTNTTPGTTDCGTGLRNAHAANVGGTVTYQGEEYYTTVPIPFYSNTKYRGVLGKTIISTDQNIPICVSADYLSALSGATVTGYLDIYGIEAQGSALTLTTGTAQAGAAGTITLASVASSSDDTYNNMIVQITGGTGAGQSRRILDYAGSTRVATVDGNWTTNLDNTSTYRISGQIGWIIRDYYVHLDELIARDCGGGGFWLTHLDDAGVSVGGTLVEGYIGKLAARNCGGTLFNFGSNGNAKITDFEVDHLLGQAGSTTGQHLYVGQGGGWRIGRVHFYGTTLAEPCEVVAPFKFEILASYVESYTTTCWRFSNLQEGLFFRGHIDAGEAAASSNAIRISRSGAYTNTPCQIFAIIDMGSNANSCNGLNLVNSAMICSGAVIVGGANAANMTPVVTSSSDTTDVKTNDISGSYTATLTGVSGTVTGTAVWSKKGKNVQLYLPQLTGTSNTTACTITGMPAAIRPTRSQFVSALVEDNATLAWGGADIATSGVITLYPSASLGAFTNSGTKGLRKITLAYSLA